MNETSLEITKYMTFKFFENEPYVCQQLQYDLIIPEPPYPAPDIIIQIASHLREFSWLYYNIITQFLIAYLFYLLGKREGKKSQEDLKNALFGILKEHQK